MCVIIISYKTNKKEKTNKMKIKNKEKEKTNKMKIRKQIKKRKQTK